MSGITRNQVEQAILDQADAEVRQRFGTLARATDDFDVAVGRFVTGVLAIARAANAAIDAMKKIDDLNLNGDS